MKGQGLAKLKTRLLPVYLIALALVVGIGTLALGRLNQISVTVDNLTNELAVDRALSKDIINQILLTRFYANRYVRTQSQDDLDAFNVAFAQLEVLLAEADTQIVCPARVTMLDRIDAAVVTYDETFEEVTALVKRRQCIYAEVLDIQNLAMENALSALRVDAGFSGNVNLFLAFGNVQSAIYQVYLDTARYLEEGNPRYAIQLVSNYRKVLTALDSLEAMLEGPRYRVYIVDMRNAVQSYYEGFEIIRDDYVRSQTLLATMFDELEPEISTTAAEMAVSIDREFQVQNATSQRLIAQTRAVLLTTTVVAVLAGVSLAVLVSRYLTERLQAEQALRQYRDHLEHLVEARTAELTQTNARLRQEIVERERTETALRRSEEHFRQLFKANPFPLVISRRENGKILMANQAAADNIGMPLDELIGDTTLNFYADPVYRQIIMRNLEQYGRVTDFILPVKTYSGHSLVILLNVIAFERDGESLLLVGFADITTQVEAEETAQAARAEAEAANRAKSMFLANMSHELRTPLNAILGFSDLMAHDPNLTREQYGNLETIGLSGEHLLMLINNVLDLSKIESGKVELEAEVFDLHEMLLGLGEMFSLRAEARDLTVVFDLTPDVPRYICADAGKLRQVLINLLGNAVKFTERGGVRVQISVGDENFPSCSEFK